jgi:hypothetical protein
MTANALSLSERRELAAAAAMILRSRCGGIRGSTPSRSQFGTGSVTPTSSWRRIVIAHSTFSITRSATPSPSTR